MVATGKSRENETATVRCRHPRLREGIPTEQMLTECEEILQEYRWGEIDLGLVDLWMILDRLLYDMSNVHAEETWKNYCAVCADVAKAVDERIIE